MRWRVLRIVFLIYVAWGVFALLLVPLSALGIIATNPLAAVLGLVLGLPWSVLLTWWIDTSSGFLNFLLLVLAIAINACILRFMSRRPRPVSSEDDDEDEALDDEHEEDALSDDLVQDDETGDEADWDEHWQDDDEPPPPPQPRRREDRRR